MPSTLVSVIHRSCRMVAESSTTSRDLSAIGASLWYAQQIHKAFNCPELSISHRVEFRANQRARRVTGKQLEKLMVQCRQAPLVRQQGVDGDQTDYAFLDLQWYASANFIRTALAKVSLPGESNTAFQSLTHSDPGLFSIPCGFTFVARA